MSEIRGFHAHVYYDAATKPKAAQLRDTITGKFKVEPGAAASPWLYRSGRGNSFSPIAPRSRETCGRGGAALRETSPGYGRCADDHDRPNCQPELSIVVLPDNNSRGS